MNSETILKHYMVCALWSSVDDEGNPLDDSFDTDDIAAEAVSQMMDDVEDFITANADTLEASELSLEQIGHDFWLTRNRHGAGFWDRGLPNHIGQALTDAAHAYGSQDVYVGDDGKLYV